MPFASGNVTSRSALTRNRWRPTWSEAAPGLWCAPAALVTGCFRSPISLSDLDLTSHHQRRPPTRHTWLEVGGRPWELQAIFVLITGFLHCIISHGDKRRGFHPPVRCQHLIAFKPITSSFPIKNVSEQQFCFANQKAFPQEQWRMYVILWWCMCPDVDPKKSQCCRCSSAWELGTLGLPGQDCSLLRGKENSLDSQTKFLPHCPLRQFSHRLLLMRVTWDACYKFSLPGPSPWRSCFSGSGKGPGDSNFWQVPQVILLTRQIWEARLCRAFKLETSR